MRHALAIGFLMLATGLQVGQLHADESPDLAHLIRTGDALASQGRYELALTRYLLAMVADPNADVPLGRTVDLLVAEQGFDSAHPYDLSFRGHELQVSDVDEQRLALELDHAAAYGHGLSDQFLLQLQSTAVHLPDAADLRAVQEGDARPISRCHAQLKELQFPMVSTGPPTRLRGNVLNSFASLGDLSRALRLRRSVAAVRQAVSGLQQYRALPTDNVTQKGTEFMVRAAAVRTVLRHLSEIQTDGMRYAVTDPAVLAIEAARVFPADRRQAASLAERQSRQESDRAASLMQGRSLFVPNLAGNAGEAVSIFSHARETRAGLSLLPPDGWLLGCYRGAALSSLNKHSEAVASYAQALQHRPADLQLLEELVQIDQSPASGQTWRSQLAVQRATEFIRRRAWSRADLQLQAAAQHPLSAPLRAIVRTGQSGTPVDVTRAEQEVRKLKDDHPGRFHLCRSLLDIVTLPDASFGPGPASRPMAAGHSLAVIGLSRRSFEWHVCRQVQQSRSTLDPSDNVWIADTATQ